MNKESRKTDSVLLEVLTFRRRESYERGSKKSRQGKAVNFIVVTNGPRGAYTYYNVLSIGRLTGPVNILKRDDQGIQSYS